MISLLNSGETKLFSASTSIREWRRRRASLAALPTATVTRGREAAKKADSTPERCALVGEELLQQIWSIVSNRFYSIAGFFCSLSSFANTCPLCNSHERAFIDQTAVESSPSGQDQRARADDAIAKSRDRARREGRMYRWKFSQVGWENGTRGFVKRSDSLSLTGRRDVFHAT